MSPTGMLGEFEHLVLLAILRQEDDAYAIQVRETLDQATGRSTSRGALYRTLDRMHDKGWVTWELEDSTPERGGHPRRRFQVTEEGLAALRHSQSVLGQLSSGLEDVLETSS